MNNIFYNKFLVIVKQKIIFEKNNNLSTYKEKQGRYKIKAPVLRP
jgi:hypothetical protein